MGPVYLWLRVVSSYVRDFWIGIKPSRFGFLAALVAFVALGFADQGQDRLVAVAEDLKEPWSIAGFLFFTFIFGISVWLWARVAADVRPPAERAILLRYRTDYPAGGQTPGSPAAVASAESRVRFIYVLRTHGPRAAGSAAVAAVAFAVMRAAIIAADPQEAESLRLLVGFVAAVGVLAHLFFWGRRPAQDWMARRMAASAKTPTPEAPVPGFGGLDPMLRASAVAFGLAVGVLSLAASIVPVETGAALGSIVIFFGILSAFAAVGGVLSLIDPFANVPIFGIAVVVALLLSAVSDPNEVRVLEGQTSGRDIRTAVQSRPSPQEAFAAWRESTGAAPGRRVPIIFVATAGGGSRAAYWTGTVLGRLQDEGLKQGRRFDDHLFAISGVSGGSLGAAVFRSLLAANGGKAIAGSSYEARAQGVIGVDFLASAVAAMFTRDVIQPFVLGYLPDRAAALEGSWEANWRAVQADAGRERLSGAFLDLWPENRRRAWPALLLNGTVVDAGSRVVTTNLAIRKPDPVNPSQFHDVLDFHEETCRDLRVSTAANNSARFPFVGPAGRVALSSACKAATKSEQEPLAETVPNLRIVDGGYFENFGATTLLDLLRSLDLDPAAVLPIVIQITSDPDMQIQFDDQPDEIRALVTEPSQFLSQTRAPVRAAMRTRGAHGIRARIELRRHVESELNGHYFHFRMCGPAQTTGEDGSEAKAKERENPPLGWALSKRAKEDIAGYLRRDPSMTGCPASGADASNDDQWLELLQRLGWRTS